MLPRLVINQTLGSLAVETKRAQYTPARSQARMNITSEPAKFEASTDIPQVRIDQTEAFATSGLKPPLRISGDFYRESLSRGVETIRRIASEGRTFLRIEGHNNPVPQIARQRMTENVDLTVKSMPTASPDIQFTGGDFQLNWSPGTMSIEWEHVVARPFEFIPGEINISWNQRPHIEISLEPGSEFRLPANTGVGGLVDEAT